MSYLKYNINMDQGLNVLSDIFYIFIVLLLVDARVRIRAAKGEWAKPCYEKKSKIKKVM